MLINKFDCVFSHICGMFLTRMLDDVEYVAITYDDVATK